MKIFVTGISGSNREKYLQKVVKHAADNKKEVFLYSIGQKFLENAPKYFKNCNPDNILDIPSYQRAPVIGESFEQILNEIKGKENVIVSSHAGFYWKNVFKPSYPWGKINKLNPDMFITILGSSMDIKERLSKRKQWKDQNLSLAQILNWQNVEVNDTEGIADIKNKQHYAISSKEPPSVLYKLMFEPEKELVYSSFPMSHAYEEDTKRIRKFVAKLRDHFAVLDPSTNTIGMKSTPEVESQAVHRDLEWFVEKANKTIVYFPRWCASPGVNREMIRAKEMGKDVWVIIPKKMRCSPFLKEFKLFYSPQSFFDFVKDYTKNKNEKK